MLRNIISPFNLSSPEIGGYFKREKIAKRCILSPGKNRVVVEMPIKAVYCVSGGEEWNVKKLNKRKKKMPVEFTKL